MNDREENTGIDDREDLLPGDEWLDTNALSVRINLSTNAILARLRKSGLQSLQQLDARIVDAIQKVGVSRSGLVWRFLWREAPEAETKRVGYFSLNKGEADGVIEERRRSIEDAANNLGLHLRWIYHDDLRHNDRPKQLSLILRDHQVKCIVTDREFSLGGRNAPFIRSLLEEAGVALVIAPANGREPSIVKISYMDEICRLLINLTLLGEDVDELMGLSRLKYKEMKINYRDST